MADSAAGSFAMLAGTEIVNDERTTAYLLNGLRPPSLDVRGNCGCENIRELVGSDPLPYTTPATDNAPWYSQDIPESARFAGFLMTEFEGMGSTFTRSTSETIHDGAVFGRGHLGGRTLTWTGLLLGQDCCAVSYGLRWLTKTLTQSSACRDCSGDDLELLVCCPDTETEPGVEAFRKLKNVAAISGPTITNEHVTGCGMCGASCVMEIEFSLMAAQPFFYSEPIPVYECENLAVNKTTPVTDSTVSCAPENCADTLMEAFCPSPVLPPTATYVNSCFQDSPVYSALYLTVPRSTWSSLEEVVPIISISTGALSIQSLILGFYSSASDNPCGDLITNPPNCNVMCDELKIIVIPPVSKFYIDGRTKQMALICDDGSVFPGEPLTAGPWSWPSFSRFGFCLEVLFPDNPTTPSTADVCVSLTMVPREA